MKLEKVMIDRLRDRLMERGQRATLVISPAYESLTREGLLSDEETAILSRIDPIAEVMVLMMAADGVLAEEELDVIRGAIRDLSDSKLRTGTIKVMLESYSERVKREGWEARLRSVSDLLTCRADAELAYSLVAAVAVADEDVTVEENDLIDRFAALVGLSDERCCELLELVKSHP